MTEHRIRPAVEHDQALPITPAKSVPIGTATERDEARTITASASLAGTAVMKASATVIGSGQPQAGTIGEGVGVLGWVTGGAALGFEVGHSVADIPGGVAGAAIGGVAACTTIRWRPARETAFKFIRWLGDEKRD